MTPEIEIHLAKEMEGMVYESIWIMHAFGSYYVVKNFYLIKGGVVYELNNGKSHPTCDTLFDTHTKCSRLGKYNSRKVYKTKSYNCSASELKSKLGLN
jgi:hypothetical protein